MNDQYIIDTTTGKTIINQVPRDIFNELSANDQIDPRQVWFITDKGYVAVDCDKTYDAEVSSLQQDLNALSSEVSDISSEISVLSEWTTTQIDDLIGDVQEVSSQTAQNAQDIADISANLTHSTVRRWEYVEYNGLTFTAEEANSTIAMQKVGSAPDVSLEYSTGNGWHDFIVSSTGVEGTTVTLPNIGDQMVIRAKTTNSGMGSGTSTYNRFRMTGKIAASESIMYLLKNDGDLDTISEQYCFNNLFGGCSSLTQAPELPATTLAQGCYSGMFSSCTSLTAAPELPSTTLADSCYQNMFQNCTSLTTPPELPATTLSSQCYRYMFNACTSLTVAPELPATTLATRCYQYMFAGCSSLNYIKIAYTGNFSGTGVPTNAFSNWVNGVAASGDFYYDGTDTTRGSNGIPTGWTVITPLTFTARQANSTIAMNAVGSAPSISLEYSTDNGTTWDDFIVGSTTITLSNVGDKVKIRAGSAGNERISSGSSTYNVFTTSGELKVSGDITTLLSQSGNVTTLSSSQGDCFDSVFRGSTIVDAEGLILPVTTTNAAGVYSCMFKDCTSLVKPPAEIPDIQLNSTWTFNQMFQNCTALTYTPKMLITSTNQQSSTFRNMFDGCTSLVDVDFDALTTASGEYCMGYAFQGCTSLASVEFPALDYIGYGNYGWRSAFSGCSALTSAKFPKLREVINSRTMYAMFDYCTSLETVDMGEIQTIQSYQTSDYMFSNCSSLVLVDFSKATAVPNLSNVNAFNDTNSTFKIVVPDALYDQWVAASNWRNFASQIVKASEYNDN